MQLNAIVSDNFYTTRELQDILNIDRTTIYRMADNGKLQAVKVGSQRRCSRRAGHSFGWNSTPVSLPVLASICTAIVNSA